MSGLNINDVSMTFELPNGGSVEALKNINLNIQKGELVSVLGPSGCGKTTLLNILAGFLAPITIDPEICHGKPCLRGMRWPVEVILDLMLSEMSFEEILEDHPELEKEDLLASLEFAKLLVSGKSIKIAA